MQNNNLTINGVSYERWQESDNRSVYIAADHSIAKPHTLTLGRVVPQSAAASAKVRAKLSRTVDTTVSGTAGTGALIAEVNVSVPGGVQDEQILKDLQTELATFFQGTEFQALLLKQEI